MYCHCIETDSFALMHHITDNKLFQQSATTSYNIPGIQKGQRDSGMMLCCLASSIQLASVSPLYSVVVLSIARLALPLV